MAISVSLVKKMVGKSDRTVCDGIVPKSFRHHRPCQLCVFLTILPPPSLVAEKSLPDRAAELPPNPLDLTEVPLAGGGLYGLG